MSVDELLSWAENTLKPIAQLAAKGEGEFKAEVIVGSVSLEPPAEEADLCLKLRNTNSRNLQN